MKLKTFSNHFSVLHPLRRVFTDRHSRPRHHGHVLLLGFRGLPRGPLGLGNHAHPGVAVPGRDFRSSVGRFHLLLADHSRKFALPISFWTKEEGWRTHCQGEDFSFFTKVSKMLLALCNRGMAKRQKLGGYPGVLGYPRVKPRYERTDWGDVRLGKLI